MRRYIAILFLLTGCVSNDIPRPEPVSDPCEAYPLLLVVDHVSHVSSCINNNGDIVVSASGGAGEITYSLDDNTFGIERLFSNLGAGDYIVYAKNTQDCRDTVHVRINNYASELSATFVASADTECQGSNGSITVEPTSGEPPYKFSVRGGAFTTENHFANLESGTYQIKIVDDAGCEYSIQAIVPRISTGVSWSGEIKTIIETRCAKSGCHDNSSGRIALTNWQTIHEARTIIYNKVSSGQMPFDGPLPADQKAKILCWILDGALEN
jgi:hypothetical protein